MRGPLLTLVQESCCNCLVPPHCSYCKDFVPPAPHPSTPTLPRPEHCNVVFLCELFSSSRSRIINVILDKSSKLSILRLLNIDVSCFVVVVVVVAVFVLFFWGFCLFVLLLLLLFLFGWLFFVLLLLFLFLTRKLCFCWF